MIKNFKLKILHESSYSSVYLVDSSGSQKSKKQEKLPNHLISSLKQNTPRKIKILNCNQEKMIIKIYNSKGVFTKTNKKRQKSDSAKKEELKAFSYFQNELKIYKFILAKIELMKTNYFCKFLGTEILFGEMRLYLSYETISLEKFLKTNIEALTFNTKLKICRSLVEIVKCLHEHQICHLDISDTNFLICPATLQLKIIDFQEAKVGQFCRSL